MALIYSLPQFSTKWISFFFFFQLTNFLVNCLRSITWHEQMGVISKEMICKIISNLINPPMSSWDSRRSPFLTRQICNSNHITNYKWYILFGRIYCFLNIQCWLFWSCLICIFVLVWKFLFFKKSTAKKFKKFQSFLKNLKNFKVI